MINFKFKKEDGFTLIESTISIGLGLFVVAGVLIMFSSNLKAMNDTILKTKLNNELNSTILVMATMIRQSGYKGQNGVVTANQFATLNIVSGNCVLFSYDKNNDGVQQDNERFGFKLESSKIKIRTSGSSDTLCSNGTWQNFTSSKLKVTSLTFALSTTTTNITTGFTKKIKTRKLDVGISAEALGISTIKGGVSQTINIRNDLYTEN